MKSKAASKGRQYTLRTLGVIGLPVIVLITVFFGFWGLYFLTENTGIYLDGEAIFFTVFPLIIVFWVALGFKWTGKPKTAKKITIISLAIFTLVFAASSAVSTINTKPLLETVSSFSVPAGATEDPETNASSFTPARGFFPCIDLQATGCPQFKKGWLIPEGESMTRDKFERIIEASGWTNVKVQEDTCRFSPIQGSQFVGCRAEGLVGEYKATVRTDLDYKDRWSVGIYLRESHVR